MKNPLRDEASAFQVVLITLAGAVLVVIAAWINTWLGLAVFIVLVGAALWAIRGGLMQRPPQAHVVRHGDPRRRILVIANETVGGEELFALLDNLAVHLEVGDDGADVASHPLKEPNVLIVEVLSMSLIESVKDANGGAVDDSVLFVSLLDDERDRNAVLNV